MKLTREDCFRLMDAAGMLSPSNADAWAELIGDACELLTMKVVLRLKVRREVLWKELKKMGPPADGPGGLARHELASKINLLGQIIVELAEAE